MDYLLATREPEEMSLSTYKSIQKRQGAELLCKRRASFASFSSSTFHGCSDQEVLNGILSTIHFEDAEE